MPHFLCHGRDLPQDDAVGFDPYKQGRDTLFLVRQKSEVYGYRNSCPHILNSPLAWRKDRYLNAGRTKIICFGHGAEFDIATGLCTLGPCLHQSLTRIDLKTSDSDQIFWIDK